MYTKIEVITEPKKDSEVLKIHPDYIKDVMDALKSECLHVSEDDAKYALLFAANYLRYPNNLSGNMANVVASAVDAIIGLIKGTDASKDLPRV
jgi:hypothetical protein